MARALLCFFLAASLLADEDCRPPQITNLVGTLAETFPFGGRERLLAMRTLEHFGEQTVRRALEEPGGGEMHRVMDFWFKTAAETADTRVGLRDRWASSRFRRYWVPMVAGMSFKIYFASFVHAFVPHRTLYDGGNVRIVGRRGGTSGLLAESVAAGMEAFDGEAARWGLRIPGFTKVFLADRPRIPRLGSGAHPVVVFDFSRRRLGRTIEFASDFYDSSDIWSHSTVRHERAHSLLDSNFKRGAYINKSRMVGEALADFFDAHSSGEPATKVRHIGAMETLGGLSRVTVIGELKHLGYHDRSMVLSKPIVAVAQENRQRGHVGDAAALSRWAQCLPRIETAA